MKTEIFKEQLYKTLVNQRKQCSLCADHSMTNSSSLNFETNNIGKWSDWQDSLDAKIIVVGQDWGTVKYWNDNKGIDAENNKTNETLRQLLMILGYDIGTVFSPIKHKDLFFTNTVLCLKSGNMSSPVPAKVYSNCSTIFLKPLLNAISPRYIIALGSKAYESILVSNGVKQKDISKISTICGGQPIKLDNGQFLFPVFHCGGLGLANRQIGLQFEDWKNIKEFIVKNENRKSIEIKKVKQFDKITLQDLPFHKNWLQVQDFAFSFSLKTFNYTDSSAENIFNTIQKQYWNDGRIHQDISVNDLRAALRFLFTTRQFTASNAPTHQDNLLIENIILRLNNILYDNLWVDR
jgi:uracil-DNA glycosylase